ncbi:hypothetical protein HQN64_08175 [Enterobacteriaceae bacterium BIT-l23]|uniref:hypothetical protein n=1 Tax=Jejubacter sp. L23 TaxID=3092086 RepID=UPI001584E2FB|nr:hypothetical protein [Enterobacteriaceae bacterium BIT-l23]
MSLQKHIYLLILSLLLGALLAVIVYFCKFNPEVPQTPCSSTMNNGLFMDDDNRRYSFSGGVTWWPKEKKISFFGVKKVNENLITVKRVLSLDQVQQSHNVISARIAQVSIAPGDSLGRNAVMFSGKGDSIMMMFKRLNHNSWLLMLNDNWILMCTNK